MVEHGAVRSLADHQSLRERIVARLRQAIITGDLAPKSRLIEPELARQLNVSRTPLREAIRQLEAEGFVTTVPRIGCFVSEITPQDVEDLYAIRTVSRAGGAASRGERMCQEAWKSSSGRRTTGNTRDLRKVSR
jgi:DNA-binding GntR family transcriptional regulator